MITTVSEYTESPLRMVVPPVLISTSESAEYYCRRGVGPCAMTASNSARARYGTARLDCIAAVGTTSILEDRRASVAQLPTGMTDATG